MDIVSAGTTTLSQAVDGVSPPLGAGAVFNANVVGGIASNCRNYIPVLHCCGGIFGTGCSNGTATNCSNFGDAFRTSGGIFAYKSSNCIASNCTNTVNCGTGGGIFGPESISGAAINCSNSGIIADAGAGGIFGGSVQRCTAINCTNNSQSRGDSTGGIFGLGPTNCTASNCMSTCPSIVASSGGGAIFSEAARNCTAINCTCSEGPFIGTYGGGIFGYTATDGSNTASNCINRTTVSGTSTYVAGGIFGGPAGTTNSNNAINCYNIGKVQSGNFGIDVGGGISTNCYTTNGAIGYAGGGTNCSSNSDGVWNDATATASRNGGNGLTGTPFYNPDSTTSATNPAIGVSWYSTGINTPFLLSATIPPCFVAGTRILTPTGYKCVETLKDHDEVVTSNGRTVPIKVYKTTIGKTDEDTAPYVIPKDAFGVNNPNEDLHLSGKHIIQDGRGVWQAPMYLSCAQQYGVGSPMTYYHIECPDYFHDDLIANGAVVESFRNKQGTSQVSYEYSEKLWGYVRVMPLETGFADKHVLNDTACC